MDFHALDIQIYTRYNECTVYICILQLTNEFLLFMDFSCIKCIFRYSVLCKRCNLYGSTRSWRGDFPLKILGGGGGGVCHKYLKTSKRGSAVCTDNYFQVDKVTKIEGPL